MNLTQKQLKKMIKEELRGLSGKGRQSTDPIHNKLVDDDEDADEFEEEDEMMEMYAPDIDQWAPLKKNVNEKINQLIDSVLYNRAAHYNEAARHRAAREPISSETEADGNE